MPLTREEQIEMIKTAEERHDKIMERIITDTTINDILRTPNIKRKQSEYIMETKQLRYA